MGAEISGLGTNAITITGASRRRGVTHAISPDYIDAGTFAIAAAATNGTATISPIGPSDMRIVLLYLSRFGVKYSWPKPQVLKIHPSALRVDTERFGVKPKAQ